MDFKVWKKPWVEKTKAGLGKAFNVACMGLGAYLAVALGSEYLSFDYRSLSTGEKKMVRDIFGDALDCSKVKIYNRAPFDRTMPFLKRYMSGTVLPGSRVYILQNPKDPRIMDFSAINNFDSKQAFIHELTHIWQSQSGRGALSKANFLKLRDWAMKRDYYAIYDSDPASGKKFDDLNCEQQAHVVECYFGAQERLRIFQNPNDHWKGPFKDMALGDFIRASDRVIGSVVTLPGYRGNPEVEALLAKKPEFPEILEIAAHHRPGGR